MGILPVMQNTGKEARATFVLGVSESPIPLNV